MANSNPGDPSSMSSSADAPINPANFCMHCGQPLRGDATKARALHAAFCCNCGAALDAAGRCPNDPGRCKFAGFTPHCS